MLNKTCVNCNKPMNGGVYRAPNKCPYCFHEHTNLALSRKAKKAKKVKLIPQEKKDDITQPNFHTQPSHSLAETTNINDLSQNDERESETTPSQSHSSENAREIVVAFDSTGKSVSVNNVQPKKIEPTIQTPSLEDVVKNVLSDDMLSAADLETKHETKTKQKTKHSGIQSINISDELDELIGLSDEETPDEKIQYDTDTIDYRKNTSITQDKISAITAITYDSDILDEVDTNILSINKTVSQNKTAPVIVDDIQPQAKNIHNIQSGTNKTKNIDKTASDKIRTTNDKPAEISPITKKTKEQARTNEQTHINTASPTQNPLYKKVMLTTEKTHSLKIEKRIDVVSTDYVFGMNFTDGLLSNNETITYERNVETQKALKEARRTVLDELRRDAFSLGANAVVGVDLKHSVKMSHNGNALLFVTASGTAVKVAKHAAKTAVV